MLKGMVYRPEIDDKLCFVLMPFRDPFNGYYEDIIKVAVERVDGMKSLRADEVFGTRAIIRDVWENIWRARLVIADVTNRNPNVNYELGICHSLGVPTILITQKIKDVPFDYQHRRVIPYSTRGAKWAEQLAKALENTIRAVRANNQEDQELAWPYDTEEIRRLAGSRGTIIVEHPRQIVLNGMSQLEHLVSKAFGPRGTNATVVSSNHQVVSNKQGFVIAQGLHSVLVQREMERSRSPLAISIPPYGRGFSRHPGLSIR